MQTLLSDSWGWGWGIQGREQRTCSVLDATQLIGLWATEVFGYHCAHWSPLPRLQSSWKERLFSWRPLQWLWFKCAELHVETRGKSRSDWPHVVWHNIVKSFIMAQLVLTVHCEWAIYTKASVLCAPIVRVKFPFKESAATVYDILSCQ